MTKNLEVPEGYQLHTCDSIGLSLPVPVDWETWQTEQHATGTDYYVARERIELGGEVMFETGMLIHTVRNARSVFGQNPNSVAREFIKLSALTPTGVMETARRKPLTTFSRTFENSGGDSSDLINVGATSFRLCGISHNRLDTVHLSTFEAPTDKWEDYRGVARVMMEGIRVAK